MKFFSKGILLILFFSSLVSAFCISECLPSQIEVPLVNINLSNDDQTYFPISSFADSDIVSLNKRTIQQKGNSYLHIPKFQVASCSKTDCTIGKIFFSGEKLITDLGVYTFLYDSRVESFDSSSNVATFDEVGNSTYSGTLSFFGIPFDLSDQQTSITAQMGGREYSCSIENYSFEISAQKYSFSSLLQYSKKTIFDNEPIDFSIKSILRYDGLFIKRCFVQNDDQKNAYFLKKLFRINGNNYYQKVPIKILSNLGIFCQISGDISESNIIIC